MWDSVVCPVRFGRGGVQAACCGSESPTAECGIRRQPVESIAFLTYDPVLFGKLATKGQQFLLLSQQVAACQAILLREPGANPFEHALLFFGRGKRRQFGPEFLTGQSQLHRLAVCTQHLFVNLLESGPARVHRFGAAFQAAPPLLQFGPIAAALLVLLAASSIDIGLGLTVLFNPTLAELKQFRFPLAEPKASPS